MWQTDISIDKSYDISNNIARYLKELNLLFSHISVDNRDIFSVVDDSLDNRIKLRDSVLECLLLDIKYKYLIDNSGIDKDDDMAVLLLGEMLFFDTIYETDYLEDNLPIQYNYSLDGILNFRMNEVKSNWDYMIELYEKVSNSREDMLLLARYIHESTMKRTLSIYMAKKGGKVKLFDIRNGKNLDIVRITGDTNINIIYSILSSHANKLYLDEECRFIVQRLAISEIIEVKFI